MDVPLNRRPAPHPDAAVEVVAGQLVVATPDDWLHRFVEEEGEATSEVAERILALADGHRTVADIAAVIGAEFEVDLDTARHDTAEFVQLLVDRRILTFAGDGIHASTQNAGSQSRPSSGGVPSAVPPNPRPRP